MAENTTPVKANGHKPTAPVTATSADGMPTTIFQAVDALRHETPPKNGHAQKQVAAPGQTQIVHPDDAIETDVPLHTMALPRRRSLRLQLRYVRILIFAAWLFARVLFWQVLMRRYFADWVDRTNLRRWTKYAREFRGLAIALGGIHIKLGQFISTRVDALPEQIVRELESLQDEVPTVPFKQINRVLVPEIGAIDGRFEWFNETPIAAASLGQVHRAKLANGDRVVIKVQRPGIRDICYTDLSALRIVAQIAGRFGFIARRADPVALTEEFGRVLLQELSYRHEAQNAARFADIYKNDMGVYVPSVYAELSTDRVLTLEDVTSIKISDFAALDAAGISRKQVAQRLMETYLKQVFEHFFFHADPHPGNLFIYPLPLDADEVQKYIAKGGGRPFYLIFIDFGMTGTLTRPIADGMVNTLAAVIARDPAKLVRSYHELGFILPGADLDRIIEATKAAFDEVWGLSMTEIRDLDFDRAANLAVEFNDLIKSMPFYLPQDFIYLGRTISILSGMATSLDPDFNPWSELEPYAQRLVAQGFGVDVKLGTGELNSGSLAQSLLRGNGGQLLINLAQEVTRRTLPLNPTAQALADIRDHGLTVTAEPSAAYKATLRRIEAQNKATNRAVIFGSVLIASTMFYTGGDRVLALMGYSYCTLSVLYGLLRG